MWSFVFAATATAGSIGLQLQWSAPRSCPTQADVQQQIGQYLGHSESSVSGAAGTSASVDVREQAGGWKAIIRTKSGDVSGQRTLTGASCDEVASAAALILAMLVNPEAVRGATSAAATLGAADKNEIEEPPDKAVQTSFVAPTPARWHAALGVPFGVGLLPAAAAGFSARAGWMNSDWSAEVLARVWWQSTATVALDKEVGGRFSAYAGGLRVWRKLFASSRTRLESGGGIEAAMIRATGFGISDPANATAHAVDIACGARFSFQLTTKVALALGAEVLVPTYRPRFVLEDRGLVWRRPAAAAVIDGAVEVHF